MKNAFIISLLFVFVSCGVDNVGDARVDAYKNAIEKVRLATTSDELVTISYNLQNELAQLCDSLGTIEDMYSAAIGGDEHCKALLDSIKKYSEMYSELLTEREMQFYINMTKK